MSEPRYKVGDKLKRTDTKHTCWIDGDRANIDHVIIEGDGGTFYQYTVYNADGERLGTCVCYRHEDLEYYSNGETNVQNRTFKLLKDSPAILKGALFQYDGSRYVLITPELTKGDSKVNIIDDNSLVEEQPTWFVEVFQVEPQYMTQPELDQFETFKKSLTKKKATKK